MVMLKTRDVLGRVVCFVVCALCVVGRVRRVITPRVAATYPHSRPLFSVAVHDV